MHVRGAGGRASSRSVTKEILLYGVCGGLLIAALKFTEYRFLVLEHSLGIYGGIVAAVFAVVGIRLGHTLTRREIVVVTERVPAGGPFVRNQARIAELGLTPRELEILEQIASGKSTKEIAAALFVSENTVKTHTSRLFDKLQVTRRTQAVQAGRTNGLIP